MSCSLSSTTSTPGSANPTPSEDHTVSHTFDYQQQQEQPSTAIELKDIINKKPTEQQQQEIICISVFDENKDPNQLDGEDDDDDDDACSDADSVVVHFARRFITKPLTLSSIKPQQEQYRLSKTPQTPNNDKRASLFAPTPQKPTMVESIFSKTTAKSGKSTVSSVTFRIPTCCGIIELNLVRVLSLLGMLINIAAFIVVAVIVGNAFKLDAKKETSLLINRSQFLQYYTDVDCIVKTAAVTGEMSLVREYYQKQANASAALIQLGNNLPAEVTSKTGFNFKSPQYAKLNNDVIRFVEEGDLVSAKAARKSFLYTVYGGYTTYFTDFVKTEIIKLADTKQEYLKMASAVNMGLVLFGVVVSIPIVILIFAMALTTEVASARKLHKATNIMIMETIASEKYNPQFKAFCERNNRLDSFTLLDNCSSYRELCEEAHTLRSANQEKSEKQSKIDNDRVEELERNKYEMAFKIFTEFIDVNGENPIKTTTALQERVKNRLDEFSLSTILEEDLFEELQRDVCQSMVEPFMKFKQEIKQQRKKK